MVVLSACLTNRGEINPNSGDDISAISRAFMIAGAKSVLATQWEASDDTFPVIMELYLKNWKEKKMSKALALQLALQEFLSKPDIGIFRHPLFWAPLILIGNSK